MTTFLTTKWDTGNISWNETTPFPDEQPHVNLHVSGGWDPDKIKIINCRIVTALDLVNVALAVNILKARHCRVRLNIWYLMGGRMDRRLSPNEPYTLKAICDIINGLGCDSVAVFCPHSQATSDLLYNYISFVSVDNDFFIEGVSYALMGEVQQSHNISLVFPDHGALKRFGKTELLDEFPNASIVTLEKDRDERTGKVNGIKKINGEVKITCIIVDDLCDGGRTFEEAAKVLRGHGANTVNLVVAHGVMSKGNCVPGIDHIVTSNSFRERKSTVGFKVINL